MLSCTLCSAQRETVESKTHPESESKQRFVSTSHSTATRSRMRKLACTFRQGFEELPRPKSWNSAVSKKINKKLDERDGFYSCSRKCAKSQHESTDSVSMNRQIPFVTLVRKDAVNTPGHYAQFLFVDLRVECSSKFQPAACASSSFSGHFQNTFGSITDYGDLRWHRRPIPARVTALPLPQTCPKRHLG